MNLRGNPALLLALACTACPPPDLHRPCASDADCPEPYACYEEGGFCITGEGGDGPVRPRGALRFEFQGPVLFDPELSLMNGAPEPVWELSNGSTVSGVTMHYQVTDDVRLTVDVLPRELSPTIERIDAEAVNLVAMPLGLAWVENLE